MQIIKIKAKNWAPFYENLKHRYEENEVALKKIFEPYKQWEIKEQQTIINNIMNDYSAYLKTIGQNNGVEFLKTLENKLNLYCNMQKNEVYDTNIKLIREIYNDYKQFRVAE